MTIWTFATGIWLLIPGNTSSQLITQAKSSVQRLERGIGQLPPADQTKVTYQTPVTQRNAAGAQQHDSSASESRDGLQSSDQPNSAQLATVDESASASILDAPGPTTPASRPVYRTTAQQLYQDFDANVVAIQTRIGASKVRVTGTVSEIDQDEVGHPVVKLWAGKDSSAAMKLTEDQRAAAAQLTKDEAVEIECDKMGHRGELLEGSDCALALVDVMPRQVNLALFVANDNGTTGVYVVGPMSEAACLAQGDSLSSKLHVNQRGEYVVWKGCTNAARESIAPGGCRLNSSPTSVPDMSSAHLWQYNCSSPGVLHTSARKRTAASFHATAAAMTETPESGVETEPAPRNASGTGDNQDSSTAKPVLYPLVTSKEGESTPPVASTSSAADKAAVAAGTAAVVGTAAAVGAAAGGASSAGTAGAVGAGTGAAAGTGSVPAAATAPASATVAHAQTNDIRLASASESDTGSGAGAPAHSPAEEATVAHAPQAHPEQTGSQQAGTTLPVSTTTSDDLASVRAVDPQAADHIASYCSKTIISANGGNLLAECRHSEAQAWTRLVLQNEFPTLDDATRKKCSEPPFPDTYVAKESCARYELKVN
jgi:hypothetical protein